MNTGTDITVLEEAFKHQAAVAKKCKTEVEELVASVTFARTRAKFATDSLDPASINENKSSRRPHELTLYTLDAIAILFRFRLAPVQFVR